MARYVALLRGINVGGHVVRMEDLRRHFEALGYSRVETVIASGNVVFETRAKGGRALELRVERALEGALGYAVATFVRTVPDLAEVVAGSPFDLGVEPPGAVVYASFVRDDVDAATRAAIEAISTDNDVARVGPRVIYSLRRERGKASEVFGVKMGKLLGRETTSRNMTTVAAIVRKYERKS